MTKKAPVCLFGLNYPKEEVLLNLVYVKAFTVGWEANQNPKVDFNLIKNQDRIYKYK